MPSKAPPGPGSGFDIKLTFNTDHDPFRQALNRRKTMTTQQRTTEADAGTTPVACSLTPTDLAGQSGRWERIAARALTERAETEHGLLLSFRPEPGAEEELRPTRRGRE
jgi:hypothetical protein